MKTAQEWPQYGIECSDQQAAEQVAAERLNPELAALAAEGAITSWWFIRKPPGLRFRVLPTDGRARERLGVLLDAMVVDQRIIGWTPGLYEPEAHAFGGPAAMDVAHELFQHDSRNILDRLVQIPDSGSAVLGPCELGILLISVLMRDAGLDWYEQGDVWARVADERPPHSETPYSERLKKAVRRLMTADAGPSGALVGTGPLTGLTDWITVFAQTGRQLAELNRRGVLERGLRAVIAHHVIFHWNRLGLSASDQRTLSTLAKHIVMGSRGGAASAPDTSNASTSLNEVSTQMTDHTSTAEQLRAELADRLRERGTVTSDSVDMVVRTVPRDVFVRQFKPDASLEEAYADKPVHTKFDSSGVSISAVSQPTVNALMLELTDAHKGHNIQEAGAGSGLFASYLGCLVGPEGHVVTLDVDQDLVDGARAAVKKAGVGNVTVILGDGAVGHPDGAPYDRIVATVGAHGIPQAWLDQLAPDGRLVVPMRLRGSVSRAVAFERDGEGRWRSVRSEMCTFMPLRAGVADDPRRIVSLTGDDGAVLLQFNQEQEVDEAALHGVLEQPGSEGWSGVKFRGQESPEFMWLWLSCTLDNALSRMEVDRKAPAVGRLSDGLRPMAVADGGSIAYLTLRKADQDNDGNQLYEAGAVGHGPAGKQLADRVAEEMSIWDRGYRGRGVAFEIRPLDAAPLRAKPGRFAFDNPINRIVIEWQ
ncbi:methyltransferase, FxLD system [Streptomyces sp. NPDC087850]|uniref:methyltransferase, FxLD system n=1 Tax=Streptomyces sp. NPDC087850 TaxID=3365809 RepID=UPI0037FFB305